MYHVQNFHESDPQTLRNLIATHPLSTLITLDADGLNANLIPLIWVDDGSELGVLRGHVARANPLWQNFSKDVDTLAVFQGPTAYISPSWYATKAETHKVVPTYNYVTVQAYGTLTVHDDAAWVLAQINALTNSQEARFAEPWQVSDAPEDYVAQNMRVIVGIELKINRLTGKWKVSQNQPAGNQRTVHSHLQAEGDTAMAACVHARFKDET